MLAFFTNNNNIVLENWRVVNFCRSHTIGSTINFSWTQKALEIWRVFNTRGNAERLRDKQCILSEMIRIAVADYFKHTIKWKRGFDSDAIRGLLLSSRNIAFCCAFLCFVSSSWVKFSYASKPRSPCPLLSSDWFSSIHYWYVAASSWTSPFALKQNGSQTRKHLAK